MIAAATALLFVLPAAPPRPAYLPTIDLGPSCRISRVALHPAGQTVAVAFRDGDNVGHLALVDLKSGIEVRSVEADATGAILTFARGGRVLVTTEEKRLVGGFERFLQEDPQHVLRLRDAKTLKVLEPDSLPAGPFKRCVLGRDEGILAVLDVTTAKDPDQAEAPVRSFSQVRVVNVGARVETFTLAEEDGSERAREMRPFTFALSPDSQTLAVLHPTRLCLYDTATGKLRTTLARDTARRPAQELNAIRWLRFSMDGRRLEGWSTAGKLVVFHLETETIEYVPIKVDVANGTLSADGHFLVHLQIGSKNDAMSYDVWDLERRRLVRWDAEPASKKKVGPQLPVTLFALDPVGRTLVYVLQQAPGKLHVVRAKE